MPKPLYNQLLACRGYAEALQRQVELLRAALQSARGGLEALLEEDSSNAVRVAYESLQAIDAALAHPAEEES